MNIKNLPQLTDKQLLNDHFNDSFPHIYRLISLYVFKHKHRDTKKKKKLETKKVAKQQKRNTWLRIRVEVTKRKYFRL